MKPKLRDNSHEDLPDLQDDERAELSDESSTTTRREFPVDDAAIGQRLDQFLTARLPSTSRARVQQWIDQQCVSVRGVDGNPRSVKASGKLRTGEIISVVGDPTVPPLRAEAEDIPLNIVYEDAHFAVINKPAGMMVHAGSGATDSARNRGTLVNALLHHMATLSETGGPLRPGIVHRLDKQTSGLIVVAKDDATHRRLSKMFADREVHKTYIALVHGAIKSDRGTLNAPISRDQQRRTRMTTHRMGGRTAVSHYRVLERFQSRYGHFTLVEVEIETGRTHQIRVHLSSTGHPVVGDTLYGAPHRILPPLEAPASRLQKAAALEQAISVDRNFLHAMRLRLIHPDSGKSMEFEAPLPVDLEGWLNRLRSPLQQK
ncbi:MAG: RluA family pseudouridine synthase [Acidobacteriaceae bacterium]